MPAYHARAAFEGHNNSTGLLITNVLHFEVDTLTSPPNWQSIAADISAWLAAPWRAMIATLDTLLQIVVTDENYPGSTHGQGVAQVNTVGTRTVADTNLSPAICEVLSFKTAVAKRYGRGHMFCPPAWSTATLSGGFFATGNAYHTNNQAFAATLAAGHTAGSTSYVPEVFSRTLVARNQTPFAFPITSVGLTAQQHWLTSRATAP